MTSHVVSDAPGALTWPGTSRWQLSFASTTQPNGNASSGVEGRMGGLAMGQTSRKRHREIVEEGMDRERGKIEREWEETNETRE